MKTNYVNIIVVGFGPKVKHLERECLTSIIDNTSYPYLLTYFDNYNSGKSLTKAWNFLINNAKDSKYICLLNNDTKVTKNWLTKLVQVLENDASIGFVGPSGNCHSPQNEIKSEEEAKKYPNIIKVMKDPISGFCVVFRKNIWEELTGFDERFPLYGSESMFIHKASKLGYKSVWRKDVYIYHLSEASVKAYKIDVEKERDKAKRLFWKEYEK